MFSNLGPLFKATFRHTEQLDARMSIRKDDPRDEGKKRDPREDEPDDDSLWEDSMGVSIASLRTFLISFVEGKTGQVASEGAPDGDQPAAPPPAPDVRPAQDTHHARAIHAYQSMAEKGGSAHHAPPPTPASDVDLVHAEDVRAIHVLIADLKMLDDAGHTTLALERSDSFLHALQDAVSRLKSGV